MKKTLPNIHPGEVLLEEFLKRMEISQNALARAIGVSPRRINEIVLEKGSVSADTALRLARAFGTSGQFWFTHAAICGLAWRHTDQTLTLPYDHGFTDLCPLSGQ